MGHAGQHFSTFGQISKKIYQRIFLCGPNHLSIDIFEVYKPIFTKLSEDITLGV